jgi:hypothetical protein
MTAQPLPQPSLQTVKRIDRELLQPRALDTRPLDSSRHLATPTEAGFRMRGRRAMRLRL